MQLVDRVNTEMNDNPALEQESPYDNGDFELEPGGGRDDDDDGLEATNDFDTLSEREDRQSALDEALSNIGRDDEELPVYHGGNAVADEREEMVYGQTASFFDQLKEQMDMLDMTPRPTRRNSVGCCGSCRGSTLQALAPVRCRSVCYCRLIVGNPRR